MEELLQKLKQQVELAKYYGFGEVFVRVPTLVAEQMMYALEERACEIDTFLGTSHDLRSDTSPSHPSQETSVSDY